METMQTYFAHILVAKQSMDSPCVLIVFGGVALLCCPPSWNKLPTIFTCLPSDISAFFLNTKYSFFVEVKNNFLV